MSAQPGSRWSRIRRACAVASAVLVAALAALHAHWALGGTWGSSAASHGTPNAAPALPLNSVLATWGVVALLVAAGALVLARGGLLPLGIPRWVASAGCVFVAFFALVMLGASLSDFAEPWSRFVYAPMALVLFALVVVVACPDRAGSLRSGGPAEPSTPSSVPSSPPATRS